MSSSTTFKYNKSLSTSEEGKLNGMVILRFTHGTKSAGGVEQHLELLNRILLERNKMIIIQMYSVMTDEKLDEEVEVIGQGKLIWVPMRERVIGSKKTLSIGINSMLNRLKLDDLLRYHILYSSFFSFLFKNKLKKRDSNGFCHERAGETIRELSNRYKIDLVVLHSLSSSDSTEIINAVKDNGIPYAIQHHFENKRLNHPAIREKIFHASGVGGVSRTDVPKYLKHRFVNLSSGIDTEFFKIENAKPLNLNIEQPLVLLPARIVPGKGHIDLIYAIALLKEEGMKIKIVFAGRHDSPQFEKKLKELINQLKMTDAILFVGQLALKELRDWYAASKVVVLPSATEGLPRVLLEAQAMKIPPVAYNVGGVTEAMINGENGFVVRRGNVQKLATKLKEILTDDYRRIQMGKTGRRFVEKQFSLPALAKRHEEFYLESVLCRPK